jgi:hypothetical protein
MKIGSNKGSKKPVKKDPNAQAQIDPLFKDLAPEQEETKDEAIIRLTKEGKKYREIQKELGVGQARIAEVLAGANLLGEQRRREEVKEASVLFDAEFLASIVELPFDYFAKRYGEFWKLSSDEKSKLTLLSNRLASKYIPLWIERYADEIAFLSTFGIIIYPRYLMTKEVIQKAKEKPSSPIPQVQPSA